MKYTPFLLLFVILSSWARGVTLPSWYQQPVGEVRVQSSKMVRDAGAYSQVQGKVVINADLVQPKPESLEVTFGPGSHITSTCFDVGPGGRLVFHGCQLSKVALTCHPGGEVRFENCAMKQMYFAASPLSSDSGTLKPHVMMVDCTLSHATVESPTAVGLAATNCRTSRSDLYATPKDGANDTSNFGGCVFSECKIFNPDFVICTNKCLYNSCELVGGAFPDDFGAYLGKPILVLVAWKGIIPSTLPERAGMVVFKSIDVTAMLEQAGVKSGGPEVADAANLGQQLADVLTTTSVGTTGGSQTGVGMPLQTPPMNGDVVTSVVAKNLAFKSRLSQVNGLLISELSTGGEAGQVTRMSLSALPSLGELPSTLQFNQKVGESMFKALKEVGKFSQLRHGGWPEGHALEIGFEDKYIGKDGPSAAVACALLLEAAITGKKWDPTFAVTGDMNADGSVQPIGGVQAKIRGATKGECKIVGVPVKNEVAVADILVLQGPAPLVGITVFGIKTFDDALLLADPEKPQALQNALTDFDSMRSVIMRDPRQLSQLLRTPHAAQRLQTLLAVAPNCYSAKYLLLYLQGRIPRTLSIGGSIEAAQNSAQSIVSAIDHDVDSTVSSLKGDELGNSLNKLRQLRPTLDARVWPYADGLVAYGEVIRGALLNPVRSGARYADFVSKTKKTAAAVKAAYDKLINDAQVREELGL